MPLDPEGGAKGWSQRKARFILTEQHTLAELGFFLTRRCPPGPFVACPDRLGGSDTWADRVESDDADKNPAWRCANPAYLNRFKHIVCWRWQALNTQLEGGTREGLGPVNYGC